MTGFPKAISAVVGQAPFRQEKTGMSGARVLVFEDYVLKVRPAGGWDTADVKVLEWLKDRAPAPRAVAHEVADGLDWLLMTRVPGRMLCDDEIMLRPALLLDCMAEALHLLWAIPPEECPFERTAEDNLTHAEKTILSGRFDASGCEKETFGPGGFKDPEDLLAWLKKNKPPMDLAVTHGDFCLPNLFSDGKRFTGFIDVGNTGLADRWTDLALGWRSLKHNSDGHYGKTYPKVDPYDLFRAAGVPRDDEKLRYYLLLDELN